MNPLTPNDLDVLIHCHTTPGPHPRIHAQAVRESIEAFYQLGAIKPDEDRDSTTDGHRTTPLGDAWLKAILATPMPTLAYINAQGEVIR